MEAMMDNSPRIDMTAFINLEPLGTAPAYMTAANRAVDRALLAKIGQIQLRTHAGNAADAPVAVQTTTAAEIAAAST